MKPVLSVVIPAYNESRRLPPTLAAISAYLGTLPYPTELLVVDDGSTDATAAVVDHVMQREANLRLIRNEHRGKGYAVRTGMLAAAGQYVLFCDADLATPIQEWEKLYKLLQAGADVAIGSREGLGAQRVGEPWYRHLMGRVFNLVVRTVVLGGIQDTQCGFKAFTQAAGQRLFGALQLYGAGAGVVKGAAVTAFDVEVLFLARKWGMRVAEAPVHWEYGQETKINPVRDSIRNFGDVLRVRWNDLRGRYGSVERAPRTP
ncbi:MAG: glycosyltransferase family 2 protein [Herpetosiphonaceae bacterium]|nr:glycosyltransferase family 2 protein [Herpetosiphonaceae bacterium]